LRQEHLGFLLDYVGVGFVYGPPRLTDLRLRFLQRSGEVPRIHARDDLAGFDQVAFVGQHFGDAAGIFRVDVNLVGFEPAVAEGDSRGQRRMQPLPPVICCASAAG
jgi:hypothetical protein